MDLNNLDEINEFYRRRAEENYRRQRGESTVDAAGYKVEDADPTPPKRHKAKKRTGGRMVAAALVCALLGGAVGGLSVGGVTGAFGHEKDASTVYEGDRPLAVVNTVQIPTGDPLTPQQIYASYLGACVGINAGVTTNVWGWETTSAVSGSGFVISEGGYIVTNYHVVENASSIKVTFSDGVSYDAVYIGGERENDVAVLKIDAEGLAPVILGDSDNMVVGDNVYTIGNPLGELTYTMTDGMVSALNRTVTNDSGVTMNMLQTNCTINSGNSGGPLFNQYGEVIGITSAKLSGSSSSAASIEGLGFAIPINDVRGIITDLMEKGYVTGKPYLGVTVSNVTESEAQRYHLPQGVLIEQMEQGGAADRAGLQPGDIITAVGDASVTTYSELNAAKNRYKAGETVAFTVTRSGEELMVDVTFDEAPITNSSQQEPTQTQQGQQGQSGSRYSFPFSWGN
ncbi:MAG: PDZ domain-containing protein [Oscillospiraceae bacterium]|nr:PDZ domain-containing protein [Oscillospiraceae bacterium]